MAIKRKFPKDLLKDWGLPYGYDATEEEAQILSDEAIDSGRWSEHHHLVFVAPDDGKTWRVGYSKGLTEIQDAFPWDDEDSHVDYTTKTIQGVQVEPVEITTTHYIAVEETS